MKRSAKNFWNKLSIEHKRAYHEITKDTPEWLFDPMLYAITDNLPNPYFWLESEGATELYRLAKEFVDETS